MRKTGTPVEQLCREAVDFLSEHIQVDRAVLFGSYATNEAREDSDIDLAVISDDFRNMSAWERICLLAKVAVMVDSRLEVKGFSREAYEDPPQASMLKEIKNQGILIYPNHTEHRG